jgi:hypothetical protein
MSSLDKCQTKTTVVVMLSCVPVQYRIGSYFAGLLHETVLKRSMIEEPLEETPVFERC